MDLKNPEIRFETTNRCAYHCKICPREAMSREQGTMDLELYKRLVTEGVQRGLKCVTLTGFGEATLDKFFLERVEFAKQYGLYVSADTTGYLIKEKVARRMIELGFDFIRFSVFATDAETYKKLHKLDTYPMVLENIHRLIELKKEYNASLPRVGVYYVEQPGNEHQTKDFIDYWVGKVDEVNVWKAHNWINTYDFRKGDFKRKKTCGRPINGPLQIRWNGEVSACCFDFNNQLITGNVAGPGGYDALFNDERYHKLRDAHLSGDLQEYNLCLKCDQLYEVPDTLIFSTNKENKVGTSGNTYVSFETTA